MTSTSAARRPSTEGATDPVRLLRSWAPGEGSWFSGPRGAMLTRGVRARPPSADPDAVLACLREVGTRSGSPAVEIGRAHV